MAAITFGLFAATVADAATVTVKSMARTVDAATGLTRALAPVNLTGGFHWTLEEDLTFDVVPGKTGVKGQVPVGEETNSLSLNFHRSYMPVVASGEVTSGSTLTLPGTLVTTKRYFLSILPKGADADGAPLFQMTGAPIRAVDGSFPSNINVIVNAAPIPTAQINAFVFQDNIPINSQPDSAPDVESGLCGWDVQLVDAGGTYGASGGRISADAFGNPLGTTYVPGTTDIDVPGSNVLKTDKDGVVNIKNLVPAKYTIYAFAPRTMPSARECSIAGGLPLYSTFPILLPGQIRWTSEWSQTSTIEGTWGDDAWVKSNEPKFFKEFGPPGHHVFIGFVRKFNDLPASGGVTVTGQVVNVHMTRAPSFGFWNGEPVDECWIGINEIGTDDGFGVYAQACNGPDGRFSVPHLKPNTRYQLMLWDKPLDQVRGTFDFITGASGTVDLNKVPVFRWFGRMEGTVFYDINENGKRDAGEPGIPGQAVNIRFRDGSIYQSTATNDDGDYELSEVFPFFNWMIAETDFGRFRQVGVTKVVDAGGPIPGSGDAGASTNPALIALGRGKLTPQNQSAGITSGLCDPSSTAYECTTFDGGLDTLLVPTQIFLGTTNVFDFAKSTYNNTQRNGGITGIVHYASTRAEFDPRYATAENNEPGVPGVVIRLYRADPRDPRKILPPGATPGNGIAVTAATRAMAVNEYITDSWDAGQPANCITDANGTFKTPDGIELDCYDGLRLYNQANSAAFDGGYAFLEYFPAGIGAWNGAGEQVLPASGAVPLDNGYYIVQSVMPYGYEMQKEEDKNVDFGESLRVSTLALPPDCVGERSAVAVRNAAGLFTTTTYPALGVPTYGTDGVQNGPQLKLFPGVVIPYEYADRSATQRRPICNFKTVAVNQGQNPAADFHLFTSAPVSGHFTGLILDDLANEFNPFAPNFSEKYAPPFMPVSIRDWTGREINRVYSDRYGTYNALVPSTFSFNVPIPSGVSPSMISVCLNSPLMPDPSGATNADFSPKLVLDPNYNPQYSQFCYTFQYLPGKTTYLDTPVVPIAAFAGPSQYGLDCAQQANTPQVKEVSITNAVGGGPYKAAGGNATLTITAMGDANGDVEVQNPLYNSENPGAAVNSTVVDRLIKRRYGFGTTGTVQLLLNGTPVAAAQQPTSVSWGNKTITATLPAALANGQYQLIVRNSAGVEAPNAVTIHVGGAVSTVAANSTIQAAVDAAAPGSVVLVPPGVYEEYVILSKRVRLQGWGAGSTILHPVSLPAEKLADWRYRACSVAVANNGVLIGGQTAPADIASCVTGDAADNAPALFGTEEGAGIFVLLPAAGNSGNQSSSTNPLQIDGFTIFGNDQTAIIANGNARRLTVSNNLIYGNQGIFSGGVRIGHPDQVVLVGTTEVYTNANNGLENIHHNQITRNGNTAGESGGGGGGISLFKGASEYTVDSNFVCGNFSTGHGGGMLHLGNLSPTLPLPPPLDLPLPTNTGTITNNKFLFNQSFYQGRTINGGGLAIVGQQDPANAIGATNEQGTPLQGSAVPRGLSLGTGSVTIARNTFQGNLAGAGDGGAIMLDGVNGAEFSTNGGLGLFTCRSLLDDGLGSSNVRNAYRIDILSNVMSNNVAGVAGGGIALQDSFCVNIINNTIVHNDSTATASRAFVLGGPNVPAGPVQAANATSTPQPGAGLAVRLHSTPLQARLTTATPTTRRTISDANVVNTLFYQNRSFFWAVTPGADPSKPQTCLADPNLVLGGGLQGAGCYGLRPAPTLYSDFATLDAAAAVNTTYLAQLTNTGTAANWSTTRGNPNVSRLYFNGARDVISGTTDPTTDPTNAAGQVWQLPEQSVVLATAAAFDEGGNFIDVRFGPLSANRPVSSNPPATSAGTTYGLFTLTGGGARNGGRNLVLTGYGQYLNNDFAGTARTILVSPQWSIGAYE